MKTKKLLTALTIVLVVIIAACKKDNFIEVAGVCPIVVTTNPLNGAIGVPLEKIISITFNEEMNPATISQASITLEGPAPVTGTVSYSGNVATFTPAAVLAANTTYTGRVKTTVKDLKGNALQTDYIWTFSTGATVSPVVIATDPLNNATNVVLNKNVTATFSVPMDPSTITGTSFTLRQGVTAVTGTVTYSGSTATFTPTNALAPNTIYTGTITTAAKNVAGTPLVSNYIWTFTTGTLIAPTGPFVNLKSVARFGIIAGVGVSNNAGFSEIRNQDVGISPGVRSSITGFPPAIIIGGAIYASDDIAPPGVPAMLIQAKQDLTDAYLFAEGAVSPAPATVSGDLGGQTLAPGIYKSTSTLMFN